MKENPALYTRKHELRAEFKRANQIIEAVKTDPKFMDAMSGEKQRIFTFELFGVKWKTKLDSYNPGKAITDLKVVARMDKLPMWRYDIQGAIYQKGVEIATGEKLPFYLAVVTKERVMDRDIWQIRNRLLIWHYGRWKKTLEGMRILKQDCWNLLAVENAIIARV